MYSALVIATIIIKYCNDNGMVITNLRLQKILYFVQAEMLVMKGIPCFHDDIEAWDFGPVVPTVYRFYKIFGSSNIDSGCVQGINERVELEVYKLIYEMVDECAKYSTSQLVSITHSQDPWISAYNSENKIISTDSIKNYFEKVS